jgi:hypothetical protein
MQLHLDRLRAEQGRRTSMDTVATLTGSIYHKYQEIYRTHDKMQLGLIDVSPSMLLTCDEFDQAKSMAVKLFDAYRGLYGPDDLGKVLAIEKALPSTEAFANKIHKRLGLSATCRIDLVVRVNRKVADALSERAGDDIEPGVWIVDFKTMSRRFQSSIDEYRTSIQFTMGQLLWNQENPRNKAKGTLVDVAIKTSQPKFELVKVGPLTSKRERTLSDQMALSDANVNTEDDLGPYVQPNTAWCHAYKTCMYETNGECPKRKLRL